MKFEFSPHVAFQVKNYDQAVKFYKDVLGMEEVSTSESETHLKCGPVNFLMWKIQTAGLHSLNLRLRALQKHRNFWKAMDAE